jgi:branched-chain amino acid transport system permease protein
MIGAILTGIVGGMWAYQNTFIDPDVVFFSSRTVELVIMVMLGGLGTVAGPVIGATLIYWLRDVLWANLLQFHLIAQGVILILIVLFVPEGIVGTLADDSGTSLGRLWNRYWGTPTVAEAGTEEVEVSA